MCCEVFSFFCQIAVVRHGAGGGKNTAFFLSLFFRRGAVDYAAGGWGVGGYKSGWGAGLLVLGPIALLLQCL